MHRICLLIPLLLMACSRPDEDDVRPLVDALRDHPDAAAAIKMHKDRVRVIDRLSEYADSHIIGGIGCEEHEPGYRILRLTMKDLREAFAADPQATLASIMRTWLTPGTRKHELLMQLNKGLPCTPSGSWYRLIKEATTPKERDETTDSAYWLIEQTAEYLRERPELMAAIGLSVVGGAIVGGLVGGAAGGAIGLALCPLSDAVACPSDAGDL